MSRAKQTVIEFRNYELPHECPVVILTGENWRISPVRSERLHFHNCIEIGFCHEGSGTMVFSSRMQDFTAGNISFVDRNVPHTTYSSPDSHSLWSYIFLDPSLIFNGSWEESRMIAMQHLPQELLLSETDVPEMAAIIHSIIQEHIHATVGSKTMIQALCIQLMISLIRSVDQQSPVHSNNKEEPISIAPALDYVREHYNQSFPLDLLAELCHLSPTHFRRLFHNQTGTTPIAFLNQTRILAGCTLLRTTGMSIAEVADQVGYSTLSSFNRHFAEMMGCPPRKWRKQADVPARPKVMQYAGWTEAEK